MCIAAPGRVLAVDATSAVVEVAGRTRRASLLMAPDIEAGEWVLVAAGNVVRRIDADEAAAIAAQLASAIGASGPAPTDQPTLPHEEFSR
jgi:hydrogenase expression/formation protein HypC